MQAILSELGLNLSEAMLQSCSRTYVFFSLLKTCCLRQPKTDTARSYNPFIWYMPKHYTLFLLSCQMSFLCLFRRWFLFILQFLSFSTECPVSTTLLEWLLIFLCTFWVSWGHLLLIEVIFCLPVAYGPFVLPPQSQIRNAPLIWEQWNASWLEGAIALSFWKPGL